MSIDEQIEVLQAKKAGKEIQFLSSSGEWCRRYDKKADLNFCLQSYRVKPEPLECWVNVYESGICYTYISEKDAKSRDNGAVKRAVHMREVEK